jgi:protein-S-isoprenylcysteine O-methyltransferase Ste14
MKPKTKTTEPEITPLPANYNQPWITDTAWITGVVGTLAILALGYYFGTQRVHLDGLAFMQVSLREEKHAAILLTLALVGVTMIAVELVRLARFKGFQFIRRDPLLIEGKTVAFMAECLKTYLALLVLFFVCRWLYHSLNEYGYKPKNSYYEPWFYTLDFLWQLYVVGGLPYIVLTRAFKHSPSEDKKDYSRLTIRVLSFIVSYIPALGALRPQFTVDDGRAARGLAVKFFFAPVMTVFFFDNFSHLLNNADYLASNAVPGMLQGTYDFAKLGSDLGNILTNIIFTIDVGLAWCGYVISSRWVDNNTVSAEPTVLGWLVCLMSYPPFRVMGGWFLTGPGETLYTQIPNQTLVTFFGTLMMLTYFFYMLPTIWFGLRFSNLTHRGIIRKGPYAIIRHPAYAAKNLAWWCVGFPTAIYAGYSEGLDQMVIYLGGLAFLTSIYYARSITEERHLSFDPDYVEYCKHVKYRFIPGVV